MDCAKSFTGVYSFVTQGKFGPYIGSNEIKHMVDTTSSDVLKSLFLDVSQAHQRKSIIIDVYTGHINVLTFLHSIGAKFRFRNNETMIEQWIIPNDSGAPLGPNARIGIMAIVEVTVHDLQYVLLIKERYGPPKLKFVTGGVDEIDPILTVRKELLEEVGLEVKTDFVLCGTMFNNNARPDWNTDHVLDVCLIYTTNLGTLDTLPELHIDETELISGHWVVPRDATDVTQITQEILAGHTNFSARGSNVMMNSRALSM